MRHKVPISIVAMSLILVSCGDEKNTIQTISGSEGSSVSTTTSPIDEPDRPKDPDTEPIDESPVTTTTSAVGTTLPPAPGFSMDVSIYKTNLSEPLTPMGILCWTVWEVFRQHILLLEDPTKISKDMNQLIAQDVYVELNKQIRFDALTSDKLPEDVVPFAEAFYRAINESFNGQSLDKPIAILVDFEGVEAFHKAAVQSAECELPSDG